MKTITMQVSDEFHNWLERMVGRDVMEGTNWMVDCVKRTKDGISCQAVFQAGRHFGGQPVGDAIRRQDENFAQVERLRGVVK